MTYVQDITRSSKEYSIEWDSLHTFADDADPGVELVHLVRALTLELDRFAGEFATVNRLHTTDLRALIALLDAARSGTEATPKWLANELGLGSAAITTVVDRLEHAGHVGRARDTPDRRRVRLVVSDEAVRMGWSFWGPLITDVVDHMRSFHENELDTIRRFLSEMTTAVLARRSAEAPASQPPGPVAERR